MAELIREHHCVYGKAAHVVQIVFPFNALNSLVHLVGSLGSKVFDRF